MSDDPQPASYRKPPLRFGWWLRGRASRTEYWLYIALVLLLGVALSLLPTAPSGSFGAVAVMIVQIRRLHDVNRTGWWAALAAFAPLSALAFMAVAPIDLLLVIAAVITLAPLIWIGVVKGSPGDNRFGPPPLRTWSYMLTGR